MNLNTVYDWTKEELFPNCQKILTQFSKSVISYKPKRILDIGCGNGHLCKILSDNGIECVGIEPSSDGINQAKKLVPNSKFYVMSCYDNPLEAELGKFDVIVSTEVIEHLYFPQKLFEFAKYNLKPDGMFLLSTPDYGSYWKNLLLSVTNRWDIHHAPLWDGGHIKFWSKKTLSKLVAREGFVVQKWEGIRSTRLPLFNVSIVCHARLKQGN
ncbi:class I SAM-dependent methyltransferase [Nostoc sp. CHAB 5836]|uniref:class I SAM-dependent methyltransferase n=1 Tax=Nostoc sp. CHAB 5836 TaxID=2780404 RepID=UPI001E34627C|nr:class I SAM-dependent methyltransferase [Nostoc sp. CHAB 5836]MCC5616915.1 class I SAM-dependent methyltransferase [Nostoc sp. CHAB 5836]